MGSAGSGTPQQTIGEMFKMMTGVDMVHVPYHGSAPELVDLIAGRRSPKILLIYIQYSKTSEVNSL